MSFLSLATFRAFRRASLAAAAAALLSMAPSPALAQADAARPAPEYEWHPQLAPEGPITIVVRIPQQTAYVYRNGVRIAKSKVSTGRPGYETPTGVFTILEKHREHYSNLYDAAPMPYMQRLTWGGVALHAGTVPGYPASHGCIRLPYPFAEKLFGITAKGATVIVSGAAEASSKAPDAFFLPQSAVARPGGYEWFPERSPAGPVTVVLSVRDERVVVLRNAAEIGRAPARLTGNVWQGTRAFLRLKGYKAEPSAVLPDRAALEWLEIPLDADAAPLDMRIAAGSLIIDPAFAAYVYDVLAPGSTLLVTDEAIASEPDAMIIESEGPSAPSR